MRRRGFGEDYEFKFGQMGWWDTQLKFNDFLF